MSFWANFWSFATALGTSLMAVVTYRIILQGRRQHKDQFRPVCVLEPPGSVDTLYKRRSLIQSGGLAEDNAYYGILAMRYTLRNVGTGPAINLRIRLGFSDGQVTEPWELTPLSAGKTCGGEDNPLHIPVRLDDPQDRIRRPLAKVHFENPANFEKGIGTLSKIWLGYEDIFRQSFLTTHDISPLGQDGHFQPWVTYTAPSGSNLCRDYLRSSWERFWQRIRRTER
jgi:hypothetical protein